VRGPEAEALAGRVVHLKLDLLQSGRCEGGKVQLTRQEAAQSAVGILDAALLPRRVRVAEVAVDAVAPGQLSIGQELRAAIEGDGLACRGGQRPQGFTDGAEVDIWTLDGTARYPSLEAWVRTDVKGWTLADLIDEVQYQMLLREAAMELSHYVQADGEVVFLSPAHIAIATKP
jgi:hypothetical protein